MSKCGTAKTHCCWIGGVQCPYVGISSSDEFIWKCALREREGSWGAVYQTTEYESIVRPALDSAGIEQDCGAWPPPGVTCHDCGEVG